MFRFLQDVSVFPCVAWDHSQFETMWKINSRRLGSPQVWLQGECLYEHWLVVKMLREVSAHLRECQQLSLYSPRGREGLFVLHSCTDGVDFWGPSSKQEVLLLELTPGSANALKMEAGFSNQLTCLECCLNSVLSLLFLTLCISQNPPEKQKQDICNTHIDIEYVQGERERGFLGIGLCNCGGW